MSKTRFYFSSYFRFMPIFLQFLLEAEGEKHQEIEVVRALNNLKGNGKATQFHISS